MPALGLYPPPKRVSPGGEAVMLVAPWVYGTTVGAIQDRLAGSRVLSWR